MKDNCSEKLYTTKEVSGILNVTEYTIRKWIREGKLTATGDGTRRGYKISQNDLDSYLNENQEVNERVSAKYKMENSPWPVSLGEARIFAKEELYYDPLTLIQSSQEKNFDLAISILEKSIVVLQNKQQLVKEQIAWFKELKIYSDEDIDIDENNDIIKLITLNSKLELAIASFNLVLEDIKNRKLVL